ncbi:recombinase family protein [Silicimonas algicola]|uniref:DNA invertase Pin-like site-specific DNA recombinase n=1 Tax=Silicimonas algicola TaxID=1826607 RepID=A0A316G308_9RHOB|nr:recombinase family protein [Silicimonas algicola]AZQ66888.1 recombinase family protein [Silicimonas algicola]PWK55198.1 DNA invertase Pin-like site-specific DNA recombinase [Silicimonas algicola]
MGELIGYARVSTTGQSLDVQESALTRAGCKKLFAEKRSGTKRKGREELERMLDYVREGDTLVCTRLDRLARSTRDLLNIGATLKEKGVALKVLEQDVDTNTPAGELFFTILAAIGQFETQLRAERQREGIVAALAKGPDSPFKGRPPSIKRSAVLKAVEEAGSKLGAAKALGISRDSVYRLLAQ